MACQAYGIQPSVCGNKENQGFFVNDEMGTISNELIQ